MLQLAVYGKGGIGKSTIASNVAAAWAKMGRRVLLIGCDPKADSAMNLVGGKRLPTVLDLLKDGGGLRVEEVLFKGFEGVRCVEVGGPEPGVGCAGRGILVAVQLLEKMGVFEVNYDAVIYDVPADVLCGGVATPIREGFAEEIYIVTSGEYMSIYAANNICRGLRTLEARLGGLVCNLRGLPGEERIVRSFAQGLGSKVVGVLPRSRTVVSAERRRRTVIEAAPRSRQAALYSELAEALFNNGAPTIPTPLNPQPLDALFGEELPPAEGG